MYHADIGPTGATSLSTALLKNSSLAALNLDWNNIGDEGAEHFLNTLRNGNSSLTELSIRNNHVAPATAAQLRQALERNAARRTESEWGSDKRQLFPLRSEQAEYEGKLAFYESLPECDEGPIREQREYYSKKIEVRRGSCRWRLLPTRQPLS